MKAMPPMQKTRSLVIAAFAGFLLALLGAGLAEFVSGPQHGHRINAATLPPAAQAIAVERPGTPISAEQWRRLDRVMSQHGGWPGGTQLFFASVRHSWYWFLALPALAVALLRRQSGSVSVLVAALLAGPSLVVVAYAFASTPARALL